jgi:hypothetical protein
MSSGESGIGSGESLKQGVPRRLGQAQRGPTSTPVPSSRESMRRRWAALRLAPTYRRRVFRMMMRRTQSLCGVNRSSRRLGQAHRGPTSATVPLRRDSMLRRWAALRLAPTYRRRVFRMMMRRTQSLCGVNRGSRRLGQAQRGPTSVPVPSRRDSMLRRGAALRLAQPTGLWPVALGANQRASSIRTPTRRSRCVGCGALDCALPWGAFACPVVPRAGTRAGGVCCVGSAMMCGRRDA